MSCIRFDSSPFADAVVYGPTGFGVLGQVILDTTGAGDHGAGYLYNDVQAGDETKEFSGEILAFPSSGVFFANDDGTFTFTGAADGVYTIPYRLRVDWVAIGTATITITVGSAPASSVTKAGAIGSAESFGVVSITTKQVASINPVGLSNREPVGSPTINRISIVAITASGIGSVGSVGSPAAVRKSDSLIYPIAIRSQETIGSPSIATTFYSLVVAVTPVGIPSKSAIGPGIRFEVEIAPVEDVDLSNTLAAHDLMMYSGKDQDFTRQVSFRDKKGEWIRGSQILPLDGNDEIFVKLRSFRGDTPFYVGSLVAMTDDRYFIFSIPAIELRGARSSHIFVDCGVKLKSTGESVALFKGTISLP